MEQDHVDGVFRSTYADSGPRKEQAARRAAAIHMSRVIVVDV